ncbi:hypothetical protein P1X15_31565 [Runella sp. MFBS21]|uniref:hypothetical protein n=1 Tax=Runella sp. MFBS21 TaxID=3034018 RepID=UPI0023FA2B2D|nr:hypothetical protein [Runella sp. MFBS21]MDF7822195.1 hypothetical protein [Runella sp. MFBS21]
MKKFFLSLVFALPILAQAQSEASWSDFIKNNTPTDKQTAVLGLNQLGSVPSTPAAQNEFHILQNGNNNNFSVSTSGTGSIINTYQQGSGNNMDVNLVGSNGGASLTQVGSGNSLLLSNNINQSNLEVTQIGNNNGLISSGTITPTILPLKIEQSGGMQISITHNY